MKDEKTIMVDNDALCALLFDIEATALWLRSIVDDQDSQRFEGPHAPDEVASHIEVPEDFLKDLEGELHYLENSIINAKNKLI